MTLLPKVKLKAAVNFPATVLDGTGIDVTKSNGTYRFDLDFADFAPPVGSVTDAAHQNALLWNSVTGSYTLVPIALVSGGSLPEAPNTGLQYARQSLGWTPIVIPATISPSATIPVMDGTAIAGVATAYSRGDHVHPTDTSRAPAVFVQAGTGAVNRTPQDKMRERVSVLDFGAVGDGVTNCSAAFQAAFTALSGGGCLVVPSGTYLLNSAVTMNLADGKSFSFIGNGQDVTTIYFPNGSGFLVSCLGWKSTVHVRDMTLKTGRGNDADIGFRVEQLTQCNTGPAAEPSSDFTNLTFSSDTTWTGSPIHYWGNGISIDNKSNINVQITYYGGIVATVLKGNGVNIAGHSSFAPCGGGPSSAVAINVVNSFFVVFNVGVVYGDAVQGVSVVSSNFTQGTIGIYCPSGVANILQLAVISSQFGHLTSGIDLAGGVGCAAISNNLFIIPTGCKGITGSTSLSQIYGNSFSGATGSASSNMGVNLITSSQAMITGNVFNALEYGVILQAGAANVNVQSNSYRLCTANTSNLGGGSNTVGGSTP